MDSVRDLYRRHAPELLRFAAGLGGDRSAAEDVVAEAFARVLAGAPPPAGVSGRAWLFAVVRHVHLDGLRHRRRREAPPADEAPEPAAPGPGPEGEALRRAELAQTLRDLSALPEELRAALLLRVQEGLDHDEIGAALGVRAGAARVRVHRARIQLAALRAAREETP